MHQQNQHSYGLMEGRAGESTKALGPDGWYMQQETLC